MTFIDVNDKLPEYNKPVIVKTRAGKYGIAVPHEPLYGVEPEWGWLYKRHDNQRRVMGVTHWRPLNEVFDDNTSNDTT